MLVRHSTRIARRRCSSLRRQFESRRRRSRRARRAAGDLQFAVDRAFAPHLGRVGGQHRADQRAVEEVRASAAAVEAGRARAARAHGASSPGAARSGPHMGAVAADVVLVLGDVGEMRKIAEGAHDGERLLVVETVQDRGQLAARAASLSRWKRIEAWRMRSTKSKTSPPSCSRTVSPSRRPSRRMSSRSGSSFSASAPSGGFDNDDVRHGSNLLAAAPASADARGRVKQASRQSASGWKGRLQASRAAPPGL